MNDTCRKFRPQCDYHEDMGPMLWFVHEDPAALAAYVGSPEWSDWPFSEDEIAMFTDLPDYDELCAATARECARRQSMTEIDEAHR